MRKYTQKNINVEKKENSLESLLQEHLHIGINGPLEQIFEGTLSIEGQEELFKALDEHLEIRIKERIKRVLIEAKSKAAIGDISWFDKTIEQNEKI